MLLAWWKRPVMTCAVLTQKSVKTLASQWYCCTVWFNMQWQKSERTSILVRSIDDSNTSNNKSFLSKIYQEYQRCWLYEIFTLSVTCRCDSGKSLYRIWSHIIVIWIRTPDIGDLDIWLPEHMQISWSIDGIPEAKCGLYQCYVVHQTIFDRLYC